MALLRRFWPQLTVAFYALFGIRPLLTPRLTCSDDGVFHIHKAIALEHAIDAGHWFARWMPVMAQGYGYPKFNYYPPLGSYFLIALHKLGLIYPAALHVLFALTLLAAGLLVLALARRWWGDWGGIVAAVAYISAPYFAFDILFRGALAETVALIWPPLILLALERGLQENSRRWLLVTALSFAALMVTHNAGALITAPLIGGFGLLLVWEQPDWPARQRALWSGVLAGAAGLGFSARFWIPALFEQNLVQPDRLLVPPIFTYYTNYITLGELLAPPAPLQPFLINPSPAKGLGLVAVLLALLGLATLFRRAPEHQRRLLFFGLALLTYSIFMLAVSRPAWDAIPLIQFVQFPWRLLGPAMLCAALLTGAAVDWLRQRPALATGLLTATLVLAHLSWWSPRYCSAFSNLTLADSLHYEAATDTIGTTAKGEFLPATTAYLPPSSPVTAALIDGYEPEWLLGLNPDQLTVLRNDPVNYLAAVNLSAPQTVTFHQLYFPGWYARLDGQPLPLRLTADTGLIQLNLPPGEHTLRLTFGPTPLRALAEGITIFTAMTVLLLALQRSHPPTPRTPDERPADGHPRHWLFALVPLVLLGFTVVVIEQTANPLRQPAVATDGLPLPDGLVLTDVSAPPAVASGQTFDATLTLTATQRLSRDIRPKFELTDASGQVWNRPNDGFVPRWHRDPPPTWAWPPDHEARWARLEQVNPATPPGVYTLTATLFDLETLLPVADPIAVGQITVTRPAQPADPASLAIQYRRRLDLTESLQLIGFNLDRSEARPGDPMLVTFFWQATAPPTANLTVELALDRDHRWTLAPTPGFATSAWQAGDVWRGQHGFFLPADLETGVYTWTLNGQPLETLTITAPEHRFDLPTSPLPTPIPFGDQVTLVAVDAPSAAAPGETIAVTLYWQASATPTTNLRSFVHLVDASGQIVAQYDSLPANGDRPAPGWRPAEVIADVKSLSLPSELPPGDYTLLAGLAEVDSGALLPTTTADNRAPLGGIVIP